MGETLWASVTEEETKLQTTIHLPISIVTEKYSMRIEEDSSESKKNKIVGIHGIRRDSIRSFAEYFVKPLKYIINICLDWNLDR